LHTEPLYCVLQLYWTLFSAFFVLRFSTNGKNDDGCSSAASIAKRKINWAVRTLHNLGLCMVLSCIRKV